MQNVQEETKQLQLGFGIMHPKLSVQLETQCFKFDVEKMKIFENAREAMNVLRFSDLLNDSMIAKVNQKLFNKIQAHVVQKNKLKKAK